MRNKCIATLKGCQREKTKRCFHFCDAKISTWQQNVAYDWTDMYLCWYCQIFQASVSPVWDIWSSLSVIWAQCREASCRCSDNKNAAGETSTPTQAAFLTIIYQGRDCWASCSWETDYLYSHKATLISYSFLQTITELLIFSAGVEVQFGDLLVPWDGSYGCWTHKHHSHE